MHYCTVTLGVTECETGHRRLLPCLVLLLPPTLQHLHPLQFMPSKCNEGVCAQLGSPMTGPCTSESASFLPWLPATQAVASRNKIHISALYELVDEAPVAHDDFCEKTMELIALRCLEDLFYSARRIHHNDEAYGSLDSRVGFEFTRSCVDVLYQILDKLPLSDLKGVAGELLKWDIFPFIMHKRATVKRDLEQLKESISEGAHPYSYHLRESSGLAHHNGGHPLHVKDNECSDLSKESLLGKILPSKGNRVESVNQHVVGCRLEKQVDINECDDCLINAKKITSSASLNVESNKEKPASPHGKGVLENSAANFVLVSERGQCYTNKDVNKNLGEGFVEGNHDTCIASNRCKSGSHNEVFHAESRKIDLLLKEPTAADDKAVDDTVNACGEEISSDSDWYHNETIDLATKRHEFLSSRPRRTSAHAISLSAGSTEKSLCVKCNEAGELQVCKIATCPSMVHKSCLGTSPQIDAEGNFYCPFCAYSRAISQYREAEKRASLARKGLAILFSKKDIV